jgi:hypothetical protein
MRRRARRIRCGVLPLVVHLMVEAGSPAQTEAWVATATTTAQEVLGTAGVDLELRTIARLDDPVGPTIDTPRERNALAKHVRRGALHVFVVDGLRDKANAKKWIGGVHWRARGRRYVIVSRQHARASTLAHEIGHHLELRHSTAEGNLMNSNRRGDGVLDARQRKRARKTYASRYRARHR